MSDSSQKSKPSPGLYISQNKGSLLITLLFAFLYIRTMPTSIVGYADSDILLAVANNGGLAHPPGYPVYMFLLNLFVNLPLQALSVAQKGHLFSVIWGAGAVGIVYATALRIYDHVKTSAQTIFTKKIERTLIASLTASGLGGGYLYWTYAHIAEKYSFSAFLTAVVIYGIVRILTDRQKHARQWVMITTAVFGIAVAHHQVLVLLSVPLIASVLYRPTAVTKKSVVKATLGALLTFASSYLIALLIISQGPAISWFTKPSFQGLIDLITRSEFSGQRYATGITAGAYWAGIDIPQNATSLITYLKLLLNQTQILLLIPVLGLIIHAKNRTNLTNVLLLGYLTLGLGFAAYMRIPSQDWGGQAVAMRQLIPGLVLLYLALIPGWIIVLEKILQAANVLRLLGRAKILATFGLVIIIGVFITQNANTADMRQYTLVDERYQKILQSVDQNALITCYSDTSCFALLYKQSVDNMRPDVDIVPLAFPYVTTTINQDDFRGFTYPDNPYLFFDIISWNIDKRPVYAVELNQYFYQFLGLEHPFLYYIPYTDYGELSRQVPTELPQPDYTMASEWLERANMSIDPMKRHHLASFGRDQLLNALIYIKYDRRDLAQEALNQAGNIFYEYEEEDRSQIASLQNSISQSQPSELFAPDSQLKTVDELIDLIKQFQENRQYSRAYALAHAAILRDPTDPRGHSILGEIFEDAGDLYFARKQYQHTLKLDDTNATASAGLERVSNAQAQQ